MSKAVALSKMFRLVDKRNTGTWERGSKGRCRIVLWRVALRRSR